MVLWALMLLLSFYSYVLCNLAGWWDEAAGLILHDNETCSTLDVQLVLHKWLCGCSLSHHSKDSIYNSNLIIFVSTLWFLFVGKNGSFSIAPIHVKHAKKIRGV